MPNAAVIIVARRSADLCCRHAASTHHRRCHRTAGAQQTRAQHTQIADKIHRERSPSCRRNPHCIHHHAIALLQTLPRCFWQPQSHPARCTLAQVRTLASCILELSSNSKLLAQVQHSGAASLVTQLSRASPVISVCYRSTSSIHAQQHLRQLISAAPSHRSTAAP